MKNDSSTSVPSLTVVGNDTDSSIKVGAHIAKLSPVELGDSLAKLSSAALTLQGRSLVLLRQARLGLPSGSRPPALAVRALAHQSDICGHASFALERMISGAIERLTDIDQVGNMMTAALALLKESGRGADELAEISEAVQFTVRDVFDKSVSYARAVGEVETLLVAQQQDFTKVLEQLIAALDGPTGSIATVNKTIEKLQLEIDKNIEGVIDESKAIGDGVKKLITNVLTTITGHKDDPGSDKPKDKDKDKGKRKDEAKKKEGDEGKGKGTPAKIEPFPVEAIGSISDGVSGTVSSLSAFKRNNERLAELYQQLATLDSLLAAVRAIADQSAAYARSITALARSADALQLAWAKLLDGLSDPKKLVATGEGAASRTIGTFAEAHRLWVRLGERVHEMQSAFAGRATMFPQTSTIG